MRRSRRRRVFGPGGRARLALPRVNLPELRLPWVGKRRRRRRFRVVNKKRFYAAQAVLALVAVSALALSASVIARSVRTAKLNRELEALHTVSGDALQAEVAAPALEDVSYAPRAAKQEMTLSMMGMPDGSPIIVPATVPLSTAEDEPVNAVYHRTDLEVLEDMRALLEKNPDTAGWINISGTVHLPVVYRDNSFYLDHDFTGAKNASGTLFLDESSPITEGNQNLLIHGHSMNDGSMFGILTHYRRLDFLRAHPLITFSTLYEKETYGIFAVLQVSSKVGDENYFNYFSSPTFASGADFNDYIEELTARSRFSIPVDVEPGDALLTLSTCVDDDRLVVVARRLRADETNDEIVSAVDQAV